jgi:hypothetical protein
MGEREIMRKVIVEISDEQIEEALEDARNAPPEIEILEAEFHSQPALEFLRMKLSDGRTLLVPREDLGELKNATTAQAKDIMILSPGVSVWWPQLDDGIYLKDFLQYRWGKTQLREPMAA